MKTLLLMRHAKSSWNEAGLADHDRPLNKRGKRDAPQMGKLLREKELVPDLILSSTAKRARKTAALVAESAGYEQAIELSDDLYDSSPETCIRVLRSVFNDDPCVLLVGHNPCFAELLSALTGRDERLPTAAIAQVTVPILNWESLTLTTACSIENIWRPRELE